jgi:crossover junction endodeoxyribonuclease RuvC
LSRSIRILGIDPGLRHMGWGIIASEGTRLSFIASGSIHTDGAAALSERLKCLHEALSGIIKAHQPDEAAVEETFVNSDPQGTLKLGQARGIALVVPALAGLSVAEYAANLVKKTITGTGHAEKQQIGAMLKFLLPTAQATTPDAADALAVAITHAHHRRTPRLEAALVRAGARSTR